MIGRLRNRQKSTVKAFFCDIVVVFTLLIAGIATAHADDQPKRVLFISSYHPAFPSFDWQVSGLRTALQERGFGAPRAIVDVEFMDTKRFPKSTQIPKFRVLLATKLAQLPKYDAIVVADDNAFNFALEEQEGLFDGRPIVFLGVNNLARAAAQNENSLVTGVVEEQSAVPTLRLMAAMFPEAKKSYVVYEATTPSGQESARNTMRALTAMGLENIEFLSRISATKSSGNGFGRFPAKIRF